MIEEKHSQTQSFKARDIESLDEIITEWATRHQRKITGISMILRETALIDERMQALVTYSIFERLKANNILR